MELELKNVKLFRDFKEEELERFKPIIKEYNLRKGEILFNDGDPGDGLFIVYSGSVRIFKVIDTETGEEKSLALRCSGEYLGEMTLIEGSPRSAAARADSDSVILKITRDDFIRLLREYPQAAIRLFVSFLSVVSDNLRRTNDELVVLYEIGKIVSAAPPLNELLGSIINALVGTLKVELGAIFIHNEITMRLEIRQAVGDSSVNLLNLKTKSGEGIVGRAIALNETLCVSDFDNNEQCAKIPRFGYERPDMLIAPLIRMSKPFGAIYLAQRKDKLPFDNANINLVNAVASQAAAAIESALHQQDTAAKEQFDRKYFQF